MADLNNPHDRFVKATLSQPDLAVSFLTNYLPFEVVARLNLVGHELIQNSFVDEELREHQSDLLFRVPLVSGGTSYVYILFEHKRAPDQWVALQLLRYMVRIWEASIKQEKVQRLPPIIPLVFYHGSERWQASTHFEGLFELEQDQVLERYLTRFEYQLCNLSEYGDEEIIGAASLRVGLLILKYIRSEGLGPRLGEILRLYPPAGAEWDSVPADDFAVFIGGQ